MSTLLFRMKLTPYTGLYIKAELIFNNRSTVRTGSIDNRSYRTDYRNSRLVVAAAVASITREKQF